MKNWDLYFIKHSNRKPRKQLLEALAFCTSKNSALDLGAGTLIESRAILAYGFKKVIAIDNAPNVILFAKNFNSKKFIFNNVSFSKYNFPENEFNLINAQFSLPFYGKKDFILFIQKIKKALTKNGIFVGQLFGINDDWNTIDSKLVFNTKEEVLNLLSGLEIIEFSEKEKDEKTASGIIKHWHIFNFITKKI